MYSTLNNLLGSAFNNFCYIFSIQIFSSSENLCQLKAEEMYIILRYIALTEIAEIDNIRYTLLY